MVKKQTKQIKRFLEDAFIHLAILLVLFGIAGLSFMTTSQAQSRAAETDVSITIVDPDALPPEEPIIGSPPIPVPDPNLDIFTFMLESDEFTIFDRGDGFASITKNFTLEIDPQDTTYPSQTKIKLTSNFVEGQFSLDEQIWSTELLTSIPTELEFDFFYRLVLTTEAVNRLTHNSTSTFQLKIKAEETPAVLRWLDKTFVAQISTSTKVIPVPTEPETELPFFDESPDYESPLDFIDRILEPIRRIFEPIKDELTQPTLPTEEGGPQIIDRTRDRYEIRIPLPTLPSTGGVPAKDRPSPREIIIPLSTYSYPAFNLLLLIAVLLGISSLRDIAFRALFPYRTVLGVTSKANTWFVIDNDQDRHVENTRTDAKGRYTAYLTPGRYTAKPKKGKSFTIKVR